uniref:Bactericidal permeability-increasing protein n=1 Tax=Canis lupus dingo TaxID=286419 RepID=A0A8C0KI22_CANLU
MKGLVRGHVEFNSTLCSLTTSGAVGRREGDDVRLRRVWVHFPPSLGGLPGGGGNGTGTAVPDSTLADANSASQTPEMPLWGAGSRSLFSSLVTYKIDRIAGISYSLVAPSDSETYTEEHIYPPFFSLAHPRSPPFTPPAMALPPDHDHMVYLGISDYFFNTAGLVYQEAGALNMTITDDMIPKKSKFRLTTDFLGTLIPQVAEMFPNMTVQFNVWASSPPHLTMRPAGLIFTPTLDTQAFAVLPNSSLAPLFVLGLVSCSQLWADEGTARWFREAAHLALGGGPLPSLLRTDLPSIAERLQEGFPLPMPKNVQLFNLVLQTHQDFLLFGADVHYSG